MFEILLKQHKSSRFHLSVAFHRALLKASYCIHYGIIPSNCCIHLFVFSSLQAGGTVLAANLALKHGWAINVGGGFHHASRMFLLFRKKNRRYGIVQQPIISDSGGGGFCFYADITMAIFDLFDKKAIANAIVVDLDAHQVLEKTFERI